MKLKGQDGQGLVEYTLIIVLVALVFWVAIKETDIGTTLKNQWDAVDTCLQKPLDCKGAK